VAVGRDITYDRSVGGLVFVVLGWGGGGVCGVIYLGLPYEGGGAWCKGKSGVV